MTKVGIIANPAAGKDVRRLVAHASVFDNAEKVNILRRILLGLEAVGTEEALIMPDVYGIGHRALDGTRLQRLRARVLAELPTTSTEEDSTRAAAHMAVAGVGALVVLGGDGTSRVVARGSGEVPLISLSTGTNNAFPEMVEGTVAGMAAGLVARGAVPEAVRQVPRLEVVRAEQVVETALVDAAVCEELFVGARAIWDPERIRQVFVIHPRVDVTGLGPLAAYLEAGETGENEPSRMRVITLGAGGAPVLVPLAPGLIRPLPVTGFARLPLGEPVRVDQRPGVVALDGERTVEVAAGDGTAIRLGAGGPRVARVRDALAAAARRGIFVAGAPSQGPKGP